MSENLPEKKKRIFSKMKRSPEQETWKSSYSARDRTIGAFLGVVLGSVIIIIYVGMIALLEFVLRYFLPSEQSRLISVLIAGLAIVLIGSYLIHRTNSAAMEAGKEKENHGE